MSIRVEMIFCAVLGLGACVGATSGSSPGVTSGTPAATAGTEPASTTTAAAASCDAVCEPCWQAMEAACQRCGNDPDCNSPGESCSTAQNVQTMFGCDACATGLAEEAACDGT
jgi:hypothetical protein